MGIQFIDWLAKEYFKKLKIKKETHHSAIGYEYPF